MPHKGTKKSYPSMPGHPGKKMPMKPPKGMGPKKGGKK